MVGWLVADIWCVPLVKYTGACEGRVSVTGSRMWPEAVVILCDVMLAERTTIGRSEINVDTMG